MKLRQHDLDGADAFLGVDVHRDAATGVADERGAILVQDDIDLVAVPGERLVYAVVQDLPEDMVEGPDAGPADVHAWAKTNRFQTLENLDLRGIVHPGLLRLLRSVLRHRK